MPGFPSILNGRLGYVLCHFFGHDSQPPSTPTQKYAGI